MVEKSEENFLRVIGAAGTREILQFLDGHEIVHYKELQRVRDTIGSDTSN